MTSTDISRRRRAIYAALALLSLFSVALIVTRYLYSGEPLFAGLIWNLFLAWIPFGLAILIYDRHRAGTRPLAAAAARGAVAPVPPERALHHHGLQAPRPEPGRCRSGSTSS